MMNKSLYIFAKAHSFLQDSYRFVMLLVPQNNKVENKFKRKSLQHLLEIWNDRSEAC